jgi:hypothetical protein
LVRQPIQHAEHGFNLVAGEERQRRCAKGTDRIAMMFSEVVKKPIATPNTVTNARRTM